MNIKYPLLLDGGLSNELERQGCDLNHTLWSAKMLDTDPEAIVKAHLSYLRAGSRCITTASYQGAVRGFTDLGYGEVEAHRLIARSVELAEEAIKRFRREGNNQELLIAASIGPYGAYLADGSEYRGNYGVSDEELESFHRERIDILEKTRAHLFVFVTMPDF
ncbi:MAG: homocysteine S-methyltransferase family protein, partial [Cyclobacteriaceae bacterium]|nr:homocysteine S-methyltransferase family protein [Cyclobacteriaceae bacterium]